MIFLNTMCFFVLMQLRVMSRFALMHYRTALCIASYRIVSKSFAMPALQPHCHQTRLCSLVKGVEM